MRERQLQRVVTINFITININVSTVSIIKDVIKKTMCPFL